MLAGIAVREIGDADDMCLSAAGSVMNGPDKDGVDPVVLCIGPQRGGLEGGQFELQTDELRVTRGVFGNASSAENKRVSIIFPFEIIQRGLEISSEHPCADEVALDIQREHQERHELIVIISFNPVFHLAFM